MIQKVKDLIIVLLFSVSLTHALSFEDHWRQMQHEYEVLSVLFKDSTSLQSMFMHPCWQREKENMSRLIRGIPDVNILQRGPIAGPMVRREWCKTQDYEIVYLRYCITQKTRELLNRFSDRAFGGITLDCQEFKCSINSLGQLFFLAKVLERQDHKKNLDTIIELGGGYGCLARIARMVLPDVTYIIIDLPEYLAIQSFYLRSTLPDASVIVHTSVPDHFQKGIIHLVPVFFLDMIKTKPDLFISTAALSETPAFVQNKIIEKKFFEADVTYLTGQLNRWGTQFNFEHHDILLNGIRSCYRLSFIQPLHHFEGNLHNYEAYGTV